MRVALVIMPFASEDGPALGPSLLKAALTNRGHPCELFYENLRFAAQIGLTPYRAVDTNPFFLTGEWLFAEALHGNELLPPTEDYAAEILKIDEPGFARLIALRQEATRFVDETATRLLEEKHDVVAFSATFQQTLASLAVAQRIKKKRPEMKIVFGGADCSGPAARVLLERFLFLDAVIAGEAEETLPQLLSSWDAGDNLPDLVGVYLRDNSNREIHEATVSPDAAPMPDFDDYFHQLDASGLKLPASETHLRFETARGCAWGEKRACAFCGLNGETIRYRSKSRARIQCELEALHRYPSQSILVTDNLIDQSELRLLMREEPETTRRFHWFVEASPRLDAPALKELADAGVRRIQPGIESLSTSTLRRMRKGTTATHGIRFLKAALESGIALTWNLLCGTPGETEEELDSVAALIPLLHHLPPPTGLFEVEIHRFSPYFEDPEGWGWGKIDPIRAYRHLHPFPEDALRDLAYYFRPRKRQPTSPTRVMLGDAVRNWRFAASRGAVLLHHDDGETIRILDRRHDEQRLDLTGDSRRRFIEIERGAMERIKKNNTHDPETEYLVAEGIVVQPDRIPILLSLPAMGANPETALAIAAEIAAARIRALAAEGAAIG